MYKGSIQTKKWQGWSSYELSESILENERLKCFSVEIFGLIRISLIGVIFRLRQIYDSNLGLNKIIENEKRI